MLAEAEEPRRSRRNKCDNRLSPRGRVGDANSPDSEGDLERWNGFSDFRCEEEEDGRAEAR